MLRYSQILPFRMSVARTNSQIFPCQTLGRPLEHTVKLSLSSILLYTNLVGVVPTSPLTINCKVLQHYFLIYGSFSNYGTFSRFLCPRGSNHVLNILPIYILFTSKQWGIILEVRSFIASL